MFSTTWFEFTLLPGHDLAKEEVVGRSEHDRSLTYRSVAQVLSIVDYVATYRVLPVTNEPDRARTNLDRRFAEGAHDRSGCLPVGCGKPWGRNQIRILGRTA